MIDQDKIHNLCLSNDLKERIQASEQLKLNFLHMSDKQQAWNDLHRLINDEDSSVRSSAASTLGSVFSQLPDKQQAWNDLIRLTNDEDWTVKFSAASALGSTFFQVQDKQQAWNDLVRLTNDEDWYVRSSAASALDSVFPQVPDKQQAWNDLLRLTSGKDRDMRFSAASALGFAFFQVQDKQQAGNNLFRLTNDKDTYMRFSAASTLDSAFSQVPDKQQAWNDLTKLANNEDSGVRFSAASALHSAFSQVPDKQQAWNDLIKLTTNKDSSVRSSAVLALGSAFSEMPDKQQAWNDLHRLTNDEDSYVRFKVAKILGSMFSQAPDKQQAWNDLHRLTNDENSSVRYRVAQVLGSAFSQVPNKQQAWNDLHRLRNDEDIYVKTSSYHSLGRVSIFMASQAETNEDYKKELEKAIEFFETAATEASYYNPSQFCLPFYRSFHTIIFKKEEAREEVDRYLAEAKVAIEGSESKKQLFEAVQNLAEALKEVQNLGNLDLPEMKEELNFYRKYCDHAAELMEYADEKAPFATKVLRKGLPILDINLKELLKEIQQKAKTACEVSQGTATKEIACAVSKEVQKWKINSQEEMSFYVNSLVAVLKSKIPQNIENKEILDMIEYMKFEKDLTKQYRTLSIVVGLIPTVNVVAVDPIIKDINKAGTKVDGLSQKVNEIRISLKPGIKEEIEISVGTEILGTGITHKIAIPLQEISYAELKDDLIRIRGKHITKLSKLPERLARKIKGYLLLKDREDIIKQLT